MDKQDIIRGIITALAMPRGVISPILKKYYYENFRAQLHGILEKIGIKNGPG